MGTGLWRARTCWLLTAVVIVAQLVSFFSTEAHTAFNAPVMLLLDVVGVVASVRAARRGDVSAWLIVAAARGFDAAAVVATGAWISTGGIGWWWAAALTRYAVFVLIAAALLVAPARRMAGRQRVAFAAEAVTVLGAGFMLVWYFVINPTVAGSRPSYLWVTTIGFPIGDLLLLMAASTILLRGTISRRSSPLAYFVAGVVCYLVGDATWAGLQVHGSQALSNPVATSFVVVGSLLMTVAALRYEPMTSSPARRSRTAAWSMHLPIGAVIVGGALFAIVTVRENDLLPWGGLVLGMIVMITAIMLRQIVSLRDSRELIVTDVLTGLANRTGLDNAIGRNGTLMLLDLDGFKLVNDAYGHEAGDLLLITFARHLRASVRHGDTCARIGGDEFAIWLPDVTGTDSAAIAERLLATPAVELDDDVVPIRASIGLATTAGTDADTTKDLLRRADLAMYQAKRAGTHGYKVYDPAMTDRRAEDAALAEDLHHALDRGELHVLYQPIVDLPTGTMVGAEALLRWEHPVRGAISPVRFIPLAERSGLISRIGLWVLEQALTDRPAGSYMSVNLSPRQLQDPTLVHDVLAVLRRTGTDPADLILEITESALVDDTHVPALQALREHGIRTAIDDFGTGYSSLQYLTRLPVDILKIDRAFVASLDGTPQGRAIAEAVIRLAQVLRLTTIAEGIETTAQTAELRTLGCDRGQGYLYARPLPATELRKAINARQGA